MEYNLNTLGIILLSAVVIFVITSVILFIKYSKLNEEITPLRNLLDTDYRKNEVKKLKLNLKKSNVDVEKGFIQEIADLKVEHAQTISEIKEEYQNKQSEDYKLAYEEGKKAVDFEIRITPLKNVIDNIGFFANKKVVELGYSHRLYINGIPCLDQNDVIVDRFSAKEINDKNINLALENISKMLDKIPDKRANIAGSFVDLGKSVKKEATAK